MVEEMRGGDYWHSVEPGSGERQEAGRGLTFQGPPPVIYFLQPGFNSFKTVPPAGDQALNQEPQGHTSHSTPTRLADRDVLGVRGPQAHGWLPHQRGTRNTLVQGRIPRGTRGQVRPQPRILRATPHWQIELGWSSHMAVSMTPTLPIWMSWPVRVPGPCHLFAILLLLRAPLPPRFPHRALNSHTACVPLYLLIYP